MYTLVFIWYFKVLSGYMSKNMVIHGTFLSEVLRWDTEYVVVIDMDKMFHVVHIFGVKWSLGSESVFKH